MPATTNLPLGEEQLTDSGDLLVGVQLPDLGQPIYEGLHQDPLKLLDQLKWSTREDGQASYAMYPIFKDTRAVTYQGESYPMGVIYQFVYTRVPFKETTAPDYQPDGISYIQQEGQDALRVTLERIEQTYDVRVSPKDDVLLRPRLKTQSQVVHSDPGRDQVTASLPDHFPVFVHYVDASGKNLAKKVKKTLTPGKGLHLHHLEIEGYTYAKGTHFINSFDHPQNPHFTVADDIVGMQRFTKDFHPNGEQITKDQFSDWVQLVAQVDPSQLDRAGDAYLIYDKNEETPE